MALYNVLIDNREYQVNITGSRCTVNGEVVNATLVPLNRDGLHLLRNGKQAFEFFLSSQEDDTYQMLMFGGRRVVSRILNRTKKRLGIGATEDHSNVLLAPMHGLVVDVPVQSGDEVEKNQTMVVLESMKMQMQLRSPRAGKVANVAVQAGKQVEKGALLVQFADA